MSQGSRGKSAYWSLVELFDIVQSPKGNTTSQLLWQKSWKWGDGSSSGYIIHQMSVASVAAIFGSRETKRLPALRRTCVCSLPPDAAFYCLHTNCLLWRQHSGVFAKLGRRMNIYICMYYSFDSQWNYRLSCMSIHTWFEFSVYSWHQVWCMMLWNCAKLAMQMDAVTRVAGC